MNTVTLNSDFMVDCSGTPPMFFPGFGYDRSDQLSNLYKGNLDMRQVKTAQAPSQLAGFVRFEVIERELKDCELVSAYAIQWYLRPENRDSFLAVCPSGYLVFLEMYRDASPGRRFMSLFLDDTPMNIENRQLIVGSGRDAAGYGFGAQTYIAVRKPSV